MKTKKLSPAKTLLLASASKIALTPGLASANGGKGDEGPPAEPAPQLTLNQFVQPIDAFIPPLNDQDVEATGSQFQVQYDSYDNAGVLFVGEIPETGARIDFVVSYIRNDKPVNVYVVYGTQLAPDDEGDLFPGMGNYKDYEYGEDMRDGARDARKKPTRPKPGNGNKPPAVHAG
ncbi:MAG: hypothetical protein DRR19_01580 [Candidatus Parabeggiatoa sp. nov. 1]|nr:MAG: hypothetical protein DRR19_01580 [Gammaproteobacteria bacterium]